MEFTKMNLRDNRNPLLRRLQRQVDSNNELKESEYSKEYSKKLDKFNESKSLIMEKKSFDKGMSRLGFDFEEEPAPVFSPPVRKQTRLSLLKIRGGR